MLLIYLSIGRFKIQNVKKLEKIKCVWESPIGEIQVVYWIPAEERGLLLNISVFSSYFLWSNLRADKTAILIKLKIYLNKKTIFKHMLFQIVYQKVKHAGQLQYFILHCEVISLNNSFMYIHRYIYQVLKIFKYYSELHT